MSTCTLVIPAQGTSRAQHHINAYFRPAHTLNKQSGSILYLAEKKQALGQTWVSADDLGEASVRCDHMAFFRHRHGKIQAIIDRVADILS